MKKLLLSIFILLLLAFIAYIAFIMFIVSGDTQHDEKICSQYIEPLNKYKHDNNSYPTLQEAKKMNLNFELSLEDCSYQIDKSKENFYFHLSNGLSVAGYESKTSKWWHD